MRRSNKGREPNTIPFSTEALQANSLRLRNEWEAVQASRDRNAVYQYLAVVFELVTWWDYDQKELEVRSSGVAPARAQIGKGAGTVCRRDPLHVRSRKGR